MRNVQILPEEVIKRIAAGEVIERPSSAIKELVENSLDANADEIMIRLKRSGKTLIEIKDNGTGIDSDDLETIFLRHATSKIRNIDDLEMIKSLGFRGEALYSLASISDITLKSKTDLQENGWEINIRANEKKHLKPISCNKGTTIQIKELFFNTPARRKFLKSDTTEMKNILNILIPYCLTYFNCSFKLINEEKTIIDLEKTDRKLSRIAKIFSLDPKNITFTQAKLNENISAAIFLGDINIQRTRKDLQFIMINNRPIKNNSLTFHINQIYQKMLSPNKYPFFCLDLEINSQLIDVNTHPTKKEVRLTNEAEVTSLIRSLTKQALSSSNVKKVPLIYNEKFFERNQPTVNNSIEENYQKITEQEFDIFQKDFSQPLNNEFRKRLENTQYIGIFINKYILFQHDNSLFIIDQHAASERINYEDLLNKANSNSVQRQYLLEPKITNLTYQETIVWEEFKDILQTLGFETTRWDKSSIAIHTHPDSIKNPESLIKDILNGDLKPEPNLEKISRLACRYSLMAGAYLNKEQALILKNNLLKCSEPFTCPHGRPTVIEIEEKFLERQFLRN